VTWRPPNLQADLFDESCDPDDDACGFVLGVVDPSTNLFHDSVILSTMHVGEARRVDLLGHHYRVRLDSLGGRVFRHDRFGQVRLSRHRDLDVVHIEHDCPSCSTIVHGAAARAVMRQRAEARLTRQQETYRRAAAQP